jgi:hypothetical protein
MRDAPSAVVHFLGIAVLLAAGLTYATTLAATVFLAEIGAAGFPLYYILFAALSIPATLGLSQVIDRLPRIAVLQGLLAAMIGVTLLLVTLGPLLGEPGYFLLYLAVTVFEIMALSVYYMLFADYFTVTDGKRQSGRVAAAMAGGALAGAGLVALTAAFVAPVLALYGVPVLLGLAAAQLAWLGRTRRPVSEPAPFEDEGLRANFGSLSRLLRRYPLVALLAAALFLNNFLQCVAEYNAFDVYAETFPDDQALGVFMGSMVALQNVLGFLLGLFVTPWLIRRFGVAGANLVYPLLLLPAFLWLALDRSLPAAIYAHAVYDPVANGVDLPVFVLNYNAVPHRFVGRARLLNDGIVYSLSLAAAGVVLMVLQGVASPLEMNLIAAFLGVLYVLVAWAVGRAYLRGLMGLLRDGTIDLDSVPPLVPSGDLTADTRRLLRSAAEGERALGLDLAVQADIGVLLPEIATALAVASEAQAMAFVERLERAGAAQAEAVAVGLAANPLAEAQLVGLHLCARLGRELPTEVPLQSPTALALMAVIRARAGALEEALELAAAAPLHTAARLAGLAALRRHPDARLCPLVELFARDVDPRVTAAALAVTSASHGQQALEEAGRLLDSPHPEVRQAAIAVLADAKAAGLDVAEACLTKAATAHGRDAAIEVCGRLGTDAATSSLHSFLEAEVFPRVREQLALLQRLPAGDAAWKPLAVAVGDGLARATHVVVQVLTATSSQRTLKALRTLLNSPDERLRAQAIETMASLPQRRWVAPLLPYLEGEVAAGSAVPGDAAARTAVLAEAAASGDRFVRAAALLLWPALAVGPKPTAVPSPEVSVMVRLLFLKTVPLFKEMTLEQLMALDAAMASENYLAGEAVVREGEEGDRLFVVQQGSLAVRKRAAAGDRDLGTLGPGDAFGEMALFDAMPRAASVVALEDSSMLMLDRDQFHSLAYQRPDVLWQFCRILTARIRAAG